MASLEIARYMQHNKFGVGHTQKHSVNFVHHQQFALPKHTDMFSESHLACNLVCFHNDDWIMIQVLQVTCGGINLCLQVLML